MEKTKAIIALLVSTLLVMATALTAQDRATPQARSRRIAEINRYIASQRSQAEVWYQSLVEEATLRAEGEVIQFEQAQLQCLARQELVRRTYLHNNHFDIPPGTVLSEEQIASAENRIAEKQMEIAAQLQRIIEQLDKRKEYILTIVLPDLEERLRLDATNPKPVLPPGMVTAIVYSAEKPLALVSDRIVTPGDVIEGVEIVDIKLHAVMFKKGTNTWEQSVRQSPPEFWQ